MMNSTRQAVLAVAIVLPFLAIIAVALRFVARRSASDRLRADDYIILGALVRYEDATTSARTTN
jgi:multisubunit Na+/H+ antiporter MnhF subunit